jgi:hypothetical protein
MDPATWATALSCAAALAEKLGVSEIILLTYAREQLRHTSLAGFLGAQAVKVLNSGKSLNVGRGKTIRAETIRTLRSPTKGAVILAYYVDDGMLTTIDGYRGVGGVVAVPDLADGAEAWGERWNPLVPGQAAQPPAKLIDDPKVEGAMKSLTMLVNLGNGVLHPRDKQTAEEAFKILRVNGHTVDSSKLASWAIRNGWQPKTAGELAAVAIRVWGMKTKPRLTGIHDPEGRYGRW